MKQLTVKALNEILTKLVKDGLGDKKIIVSDDEEGNGYHGCFYATTDYATVKECIEVSNGITDSEEKKPENLIIIG